MEFSNKHKSFANSTRPAACSGSDINDRVEEFTLPQAGARDVKGDQLHAGFRAGRGGDAKGEFATRLSGEPPLQHSRFGGDAGRRMNLDAMSLRA